MADTIKKVDNIYYLQIGVQGENVSREVQMDVTEWIEKYPNGHLYILFKRYNDQWGYPVATTYEDGILTWTPSVADTSVPGVGYAEVRMMDAATESVRKSRIIPTVVENSVSGLDGAEVPSPFREWTNQVLAAATAVEEGLDELAALAERTEDAADAAETAAAAAPTEVSSEVTYQVSASGDTVPTGTWLNYIPNVPQGNWLWSRTILAWNNGTYSDPIYAKTRIGLDGNGSVVSVNDTSPDANGNVDLGEIVHKVNNVSPDSSGNVSLPIDAAPTAGSDNPVKSGALKTALDGKVNKAGDTMSGLLKMPSASGMIAADNNYSYILYYDSTGTVRTAGMQSNPNNGIDLVEYSPGTDKFEMFSLPQPETNRTTNITYKILTEKPGSGDLYYAAGDTFSTTTDMMMCGHVTNGGKLIQLGVWLPKSLNKITNVTVTAFNGSIRGVNGYVNNYEPNVDILNQSGITITAFKTTPNGVRVHVQNTSAYTNVQNNTPVVFSGKITLLFS
jgi:hypothetical protein